MMEAGKNDEQVKMGIQRRIHSGIKLSSSVHSGSDELEPHSRQNRQYGALCSILREMDKTMSAEVISKVFNSAGWKKGQKIHIKLWATKPGGKMNDLPKLYFTMVRVKIEN